MQLIPSLQRFLQRFFPFLLKHLSLLTGSKGSRCLLTGSKGSRCLLTGSKGSRCLLTGSKGSKCLLTGSICLIGPIAKETPNANSPFFSAIRYFYYYNRGYSFIFF